MTTALTPNELNTLCSLLDRLIVEQEDLDTRLSNERAGDLRQAYTVVANIRDGRPATGSLQRSAGPS